MGKHTIYTAAGRACVYAVILLAAMTAFAALSGRAFAESGVQSDFNGDGFDDLAVGVPGESVGRIVSAAGAVNVIYGAANGLTSAGNQFWHQNSPGILDAVEGGEDESFGSSLTAGDFNGDGFDDLAVGVPFEDIGNIIFAGAVNVIYGSASGLTSAGNQFWHQNSPGILDPAEEGDKFGGSLTAGDFDGDGFDDLAIGVGEETIGGTLQSAGAVNVIYGAANGLTSAGNQFWHQNSPGILDAAEQLDNFGESLTAGDFDGDGFDDLAVGGSGEDVGIIESAGAVNVIYGAANGLTSAGNQFWHQDRPGILDVAEESDDFGRSLTAGDFDSDGFDDLAVGVFFEDIPDLGANILAAGAVNVIYGTVNGLTSAGDQFWHQNSPGILDAAEPEDFFSSSLTAGDFNGDGFDDLAVGVSREDVGSLITEDVGVVNVIYGTSGSGLNSAGNQFRRQDHDDILGAPEPEDFFGSSLTAGDFDGNGRDDLAVGVPGENIGLIVDAGAVNVLYGLNFTGNQFWNQNSAGILGAAEADDFFSSLPQ